MNVRQKPGTQDFQFIGGAVSLDFVNTVGNCLGARREYLRSPRELKRWSRLANIIERPNDFFISSADLAEFLSAREELYRLFKAAADCRPLPKAAVENLNRRLAASAPHRQIVAGNGDFRWAWRIAWRDPARLMALIVFDAAALVTSGQFRKIRECADATCGWLFLDRSQAGKRRWCSMADCGNRDKVRRYYRRQGSARSQH